MSRPDQLTHLDLFSGIGGFALAAKRAGYRTVGFCEIEPYARSVLAHHFPGIRQHEDVRLLGADDFADGSPDLITAGTPCQPTSLVGRRRGDLDERWLWPDTLRIIRELHPRDAVMENPRAILSLNGGRAFAGILAELCEIGYDVLWDVIPAAAIGAGHRRERVFILASDPMRSGLEGHTRNDGAPSIYREGATGPDRAQDIRTDARPRRRDQFWYEAESPVCAVVDGIPADLLRLQLTAVGNSVHPQVAFQILKAIAEIESRAAYNAA